MVHNAADASPIIINSNNILYAEKSEMYVGATYIQLNDMDMDVLTHGYHVTETPEKLMEMLK